jgi:hypothetical protein
LEKIRGEERDMGILIRTTFEIITPESAEDGEAAERGWIDEEGTEYGFRELVGLARLCEASCSAPCPRAWLTVCGYDEDYRTGVVENRSYHPVSKRDARYFAKALRMAGLWR